MCSWDSRSEQVMLKTRSVDGGGAEPQTEESVVLI
jgi:hypothetical protein